jgi:signal transduction histidine kinase
MQRTPDTSPSLSRVPVTARHTIESTFSKSTQAYRSLRIKKETLSESNFSDISMHVLSVSALGVGIPALLGYDVAWSTVAYTVLVIAALAAAAWSTHKLMKRNERLEQLVEQRTSHIQMQARQLARYNAELIRSNKMLQQTMDEKSKVLGVAAHDLKNSVFGICALSEVMLEEDAGNGQSVRRLSLIHNSAEEAMTLINNLLSSAASSVHGDLEKQAVNVGTMAELVRHSFADQAKRKQQQITCDGPATDAFVEGDEDRLREALNNLVSNAVKYAPLNSTIRLAVQATDDNIYVSVADEGPGLSPHEQEALFTPFKRLSPEPTGNEGSSGLGLYIVQQIVDRHEGTIRVDSTKGEGSTFTVMLPRIDPPESAVNLEPSAHDQKPVMGY